MLLNPIEKEQIDGLIETFADLLVGRNDKDTVDQVILWAVYNHIHKTMPNLSAHWGASNPEGKAAMRRLFEEIKGLNAAHRGKKEES